MKNPARTWKISNYYDQNALTFTDDSDERLRIKSDGKVGIGTNNPDELLELAGTDPVLKLHDSTGGATHGFKLNHDHSP